MIFRKQKHSSYWYSKTIGQAKNCIIENIINEPTTTLDKVAIVLGEENFGSTLYSLPPLLVL
jgi:hypothetical protein